MINLRNLTAWGKIAETIVGWYILVIVLYAVLWIIWILSGSNFYNMITNMTAALVGLVIIIIIMEILRRKVKQSQPKTTVSSYVFHDSRQLGGAT